MKVAEKLKEAAKSNKKKMVIGGAVIFIGCAGAYVYMSKQGNGALTGSPQGQEQGQETASSTSIKRPDREPDIMGIVESVNGNEVKILKLDASSMPGANRDGNGSGQNNSGAKGSSQNADRGNMQPPADMAQGAQGQSGSTSGKKVQSEMLAELKKKSTGEETIIVPVGIQMLKMGGGQPGSGNRPSRNNNTGDGSAKTGGNNAGNKPQQGGGEVEATISDITADKMVMIWLNSNVTDRKVAEFVSIMR